MNKTKQINKSLEKSGLNEKQKAFCREYIYDWNGSRAYKLIYGDVTDGTARANASELLTKPNIKEYIEQIQQNLEEMAGISRLKIISEHIKLAFSSIAYMHNTWVTRKEFESLTDDQKSCIAEIDTKIKTEYEFNLESKEKEPIRVEYVKIKLYDKQKALDSISKMLGYDAPVKIDSNMNLNVQSLPDVHISGVD